jgi:hypothetical protein
MITGEELVGLEKPQRKREIYRATYRTGVIEAGLLKEMSENWIILENLVLAYPAYRDPLT